MLLPLRALGQFTPAACPPRASQECHAWQLRLLIKSTDNLGIFQILAIKSWGLSANKEKLYCFTLEQHFALPWWQKQSANEHSGPCGFVLDMWRVYMFMHLCVCSLMCVVRGGSNDLRVDWPGLWRPNDFTTYRICSVVCSAGTCIILILTVPYYCICNIS